MRTLLKAFEGHRANITAIVRYTICVGVALSVISCGGSSQDETKIVSDPGSALEDKSAEKVSLEDSTSVSTQPDQFDVFMSPAGGFAPINTQRTITTETGSTLDPTIENAALNMIRQAGPGSRIRIAMYSLSSPTIMDALFRAAARGAEIKIIVDAVKAYDRSSRERLVEQNRSAGSPIEIKYVTGNIMKAHGRSRMFRESEELVGTMHAKFAIFETDDSTQLFIGSANLSNASNSRLAENRIVIRDDPVLAKALRHEFAQIWENFGECASERCTSEEIPESASSGESRFISNAADFKSRPLSNATIELLEDAFHSDGRLDVAMFYLSDRRLAEAVLDGAKRSPKTKIRVLLDSEMKSDSDDPEILGLWLATEGRARRLENLTVRFLSNGAGFKMHHKFFIVNSDTLVNGSFNWTPMGDLNIENMLVLTRKVEPHQPAIDRFQSEFEELWSRAENPTSLSF